MNLQKKNLSKIIITLVGIFFGVINLFPFIFMLSSSLKPELQIFEFPFKMIPNELYLKNFVDVLSDKFDFLGWYGNTIVMTLLSIVLRLSIICPAAYAFGRLKFKHKEKIFLFFITALMIPGDVTLIQRYIIYKAIGITNSMWALILPAAFDIYFVFMLRQFFMSIPFELSEAAKIDGAGQIRIFLQIIFPLVSSAIITIVLFTFVWQWNDFTNPFIFITDIKRQMLSVGITMFQGLRGANYGNQLAAAVLAVIPLIITFSFLQNYFIEGIATSGIKG